MPETSSTETRPNDSSLSMFANTPSSVPAKSRSRQRRLPAGDSFGELVEGRENFGCLPATVSLARADLAQSVD